MENFRPPVMDEVHKKQAKNKLTSILIITTISIFVFGVVGLITYKKLQSHFTIQATPTKEEALLQYYDALITQNSTVLDQIAPQLDHKKYNIIKSKDIYSLFVFPDYHTNNNALFFQIIDYSTTPQKVYFYEATFSTNQANIIDIKEIYIGKKIN